jgi:SAM-dependent methyltransferase
MVEPYRVLASVYNRAQLSAYSLEIVPRLLEMAFLEDWLGRIILELGCGTGEAACWLTERSYRVIAVDNSAAMINVGKTYATTQGLDVEWTNADMRHFKPDMRIDLALSLDGTLNLLPTLQDLEAVIQMVYEALDAGKLFIFDLDTLRGLIAQGDHTAILFDDKKTTLITTQSTLNYETLTRTVLYRIMIAADNDTAGVIWRRADETHMHRGFPIPAVVRILTRVGFRVLKTLDTMLEPVDPNNTDRVIIMAQKPKSDAP